MQYQYVPGRTDYSNLTSGRVFYSLPGHPAFPIRLASEIFQRCFAYREKIYNNSTRCTIYDPCCGAAYHLSVLAYLHGYRLRGVIASDIDEKAANLAKRNLGLLTGAGLDDRIDNIKQMIELYGKQSHRDALKSAQIMKNKLIASALDHSLEIEVFQASAVDGSSIARNIKTHSVDIVFTDVPYDQQSHWIGSDSGKVVDPLWSMLDALIELLSSASIVAIVSDKHQKALNERYQRVEQFQIGKRRVIILRPV